MRFIVHSAGAIGSIIGGHLFRTGQEVTLVATSDHVEKIRESWRRLVMSEETYDLQISVRKEAEELVPFREDDVVLLTPRNRSTPCCA